MVAPSVDGLLPRLTRLYPFYKGRGRLALSPMFRSHSGVVAETIRVSLRTGETIHVVENDYIGRMVRFFGDLDPAVSGVVRDLVRRGDVVLDVGANVGIVTLLAASIVGNDGHVFAFEPIKLLSTLLSRSAAENRLDNISIFNIALSDFAGKGSMDVHDGSLGGSTLNLQGEGQPCEIRVLDEIDFGDNFRRPRVLKIDVEGHEAKVLAGGRAFLAEYPPDYVLFESHADRGHFWERPEITILRECGYDFAVILRTAFGRPVLRKIAASDSIFTESYDFLATNRTLGV